MHGSAEEIPRDLVNRLLLERAARFSRAVDDEANEHTEVILFEQADCRYAVPLSALSEIRPVQAITVLPQAPAGVMGVINVRGRIVTVYRLAAASSQVVGDQPGQALIGQGRTAGMALHADTVLGAERLSSAAIRPPPISMAALDYITGIGTDGTVFIDPDKFNQFHNSKKS